MRLPYIFDVSFDDGGYVLDLTIQDLVEDSANGWETTADTRFSFVRYGEGPHLFSLAADGCDPQRYAGIVSQLLSDGIRCVRNKHDVLAGDHHYADSGASGNDFFTTSVWRRRYPANVPNGKEDLCIPRPYLLTPAAVSRYGVLVREGISPQHDLRKFRRMIKGVDLEGVTGPEGICVGRAEDIFTLAGEGSHLYQESLATRL